MTYTRVSEAMSAVVEIASRLGADVGVTGFRELADPHVGMDFTVDGRRYTAWDTESGTYVNDASHHDVLDVGYFDEDEGLDPLYAALEELICAITEAVRPALAFSAVYYSAGGV